MIMSSAPRNLGQICTEAQPEILQNFGDSDAICRLGIGCAKAGSVEGLKHEDLKRLKKA